jgi:hypothetical protein
MVRQGRRELDGECCWMSWMEHGGAAGRDKFIEGAVGNIVVLLRGRSGR